MKGDTSFTFLRGVKRVLFFREKWLKWKNGKQNVAYPRGSNPEESAAAGYVLGCVFHGQTVVYGPRTQLI